MTTDIRQIDWNAAWQAAKAQSTFPERDAAFWITVHPVNRTYENHEDAFNSCSWVLDHITADESERLRAWFGSHLVKENGCWVLAGSSPVRWAVIWWDPAAV